jgi:hypothetical protein
VIENGCAVGIRGMRCPNINKVHLESSLLLVHALLRSAAVSYSLPEIPFGADTKVLQDKPDADFVVRVGQSKSARAETANKITREHAPGRSRLGG